MTIRLNSSQVFSSAFCGMSNAAKAAFLGLLAVADQEGIADINFVCRNYSMPQLESVCDELVTAGAIVAIDDGIVAIKQWPMMRVRNSAKVKSAYPTMRKRLKVRDDQYVYSNEAKSEGK